MTNHEKSACYLILGGFILGKLNVHDGRVN